MKQKLKSNSGFTLIELIIAMAVLAFLMTAVSSFMGTGVLSFRKSKADINVHNTAQNVYEQLADSIMSANDIIICAYVIDGTLVATSSDADAEISFIVAGDPADQMLDGPYYFVRANEEKDKYEKTVDPESGEEVYALDGEGHRIVKPSAQETSLKTGSLSKYALEVKGYITYDDLPAGVKLYPIQIIVDHAIAIDPSCCTGLTLGSAYANAFTGEMVTIEQQTRKELNEYGVEEEQPVKTSDGLPVYNVNDTERCIFTFNEKYMYLEREYAFMDKLNDFSTTRATSTLTPYMYTDAFNYVTMSMTAPDDSSTTASLPGCVLSIDDGQNAIGLEMFFYDKNTTYSTSSLINTRNTYVLRAKK